MMDEIPDFEAKHTEETVTGREELDTEAAARDIGGWLKQELGVDVQVKDRRPQHELQDGGAVVFRIDIEDTSPEITALLGAIANELDADLSVSEATDTVRLKKWHADHPVYSDYFGTVNGWKNTSHPFA